MSDPYDSPAAQVRANFRAWEERGRGWAVYPYLVELEPPFRPFENHWAWSTPVLDDGRRPGLWASLFGSPPPSEPVLPPGFDIGPEEPEPGPAHAYERLSELQVLLPPGFDLPQDAHEQLLLSARIGSPPTGFEFIGYAGTVSLQLTCDWSDRSYLRAQLATLAPEAAVLEREGFLHSAWEGTEGVPIIVDLGLANEFMRPLRTGRIGRADPLSPPVAALADAREGEIQVLQVLFSRVQHSWEESILRAVHGNDGEPLFVTGPELVRQAQEKITRPLFACRMRLAGKGATRVRTIEMLRGLLSALTQFSTTGGNELIALDSVGWEEEEQGEDLLQRTAHRPGMLLNSGELAGFVHLPGSAVGHPQFQRLTRHTKPAPEIATGAGLLLGVNEHLGTRREVRVHSEQRMRHTYVIGASGTGKSTLLLSMILQDIESGEGVAVLDPHGDLIEEVLGRIPEGRIEDVVLFDPADEEYPVGFNILSAHTELERTLLSSDLVAVFRRLSTSWGDQMNSVFANAILAFLESSEGGTLADLRRFLVDPGFRAAVLATVTDPEIVYYWQKEFPLLKGAPQALILTRLDAFLRPKLIRNIVCQRESRLDLSAVMDSGRIFLVKLSQGAIGEENSYLLGALLVAKLQQAALSRQEQHAARRRDFFLYIDEFQNFATPSLTALLSGVRKYRMGLTLAHQDLRQLGGRSDELTSSVLSNAATRIVFRVGDQDARALAEGFSSFEVRDLQNLGVGDAICRVERADFDFNLSTRPLPGVDADQTTRRRQEVVTASRERYATPRDKLAASLPFAPEAIAPRTAPARVPEPSLSTAEAAPSPAPPPAEKPTRAKPVPAASPGRGGQHHKYLQSLIRRFGEDRGYRVTVEKSVLDGAGYVDVALEREGLSVAVEISVTTTLEHEIGNVQKCIAAGFDQVVLILTERKGLAKARQRLRQVVPEQDMARIRVLAPEELVSLLDAFNANAAKTEMTVGGYKVKVKYEAVNQEEQERRSKGIGEVIGKALKRLRGKEA